VIKRSHKLHEQQVAIERCSTPSHALERFHQICKSYLRWCAEGDDGGRIDHDELQALAEHCEDELLGRVPEESCKQMLEQAARVPMSRLRNLGNYEPVVRADLRLRKLALLTVKAAARPYSGKMRSWAWDRLIWKAELEYDTAKYDWERASRDRSRRGSRVRRSRP
jgi:hypothetical protein